MRVVGGTLGGRTLAGSLPGGLRPTADRVREALFNILGARVPGAPFVDLCAGTGAVGIEAFSRGALPVTLVESASRSLAVIERNLERLGLAGAAVRPAVVRADVTRYLAGAALGEHLAGASAGIVFLDPPYAERRLRRWLARLAEPGLLAPGTLVIVEHATREPVPWAAGRALGEAWSRRYGDTTLSAAEVPPA